MHVSHHLPLLSYLTQAYLTQALPEPNVAPKPRDELAKSTESASIAEDLKQDGKQGNPMLRRPQKQNLRKPAANARRDDAKDSCPAAYPFFL